MIPKPGKWMFKIANMKRNDRDAMSKIFTRIVGIMFRNEGNAKANPCSPMAIKNIHNPLIEGALMDVFSAFARITPAMSPAATKTHSIIVLLDQG